MPLHEKLEVFYCIFEVTTPYVTQRQEMEAPRIMLEQRFIALVEQAAASNEPIKVAIRRPIPIWSRSINSGLIARQALSSKTMLM